MPISTGPPPGVSTCLHCHHWDYCPGATGKTLLHIPATFSLPYHRLCSGWPFVPTWEDAWDCLLPATTMPITRHLSHTPPLPGTHSMGWTSSFLWDSLSSRTLGLIFSPPLGLPYAPFSASTLCLHCTVHTCTAPAVGLRGLAPAACTCLLLPASPAFLTPTFCTAGQDNI